MFIQRNTKHVGDKVYHSVLLREGYRENGRIRMRTLLNLGSWAPDKVEALGKILAGERLAGEGEIELLSGRSFGGLWVLKELSDRLGITAALGDGRAARLVLFMVLARVINQGSKLASVGWAKGTATKEVLGLARFDEDDLYEALDWLSERQDAIEDELFLRRNEACDLFLYDVTSSYLEGDKNELGAYGYNRDKKKGKKQIVVGLLTDRKGYPISVQVFDGNTNDPSTMRDQIEKAAARFNAKSATFVGDKGMIKKVQIEHLGDLEYFYITSITKAQIESLMNQGVLQLSLFDSDVVEVCQDRVRYVLRRNPVRAREVKENREDRLKKALLLLDEEISGLEQSKRRDPNKALRRLIVSIDKLGLSRFITIDLNDRVLSYSVDEKAIADAQALDGCYAIKSDVPKDKLSADEIHDRYKDLIFVEQAFRSMKTALLEIRPIYLRKACRTRAHVFVTMLAYAITHEFQRHTKPLDLTRRQAITMLERIQISEIKVGQTTITKIAAPDSDQQRVLSALDIKLPSKPGDLPELTRIAAPDQV